jgi:hypothetical protein
MKMKTLLALCLFLSRAAKAQSLYDNFNSSSVDANLWNVILPFSQSQISESGGVLTTTGRGMLATTANFASPYSISGAVTLNSSLEHFQFVLRSDLSFDTASGIAQYDELNGIHVSFSADGQQAGIALFDGTNPNPPNLALTSYSFSVGQTYDFSITDTGSSVDLSIDGTDIISADTTFGTGDQIAFYSREFSDTSSSLDFASIAPVPEPSSFALAGLGILGLIGMTKFKKKI